MSDDETRRQLIERGAECVARTRRVIAASRQLIDEDAVAKNRGTPRPKRSPRERGFENRADWKAREK